MFLKMNLFITFSLFGAVISDEAEEDAPYSIENVWKSSNNDCTCTCAPDWAKGVQQYYDDVMIAFSSFPESLKEQADIVKIPFEAYLTKLVDFSNSDSTVLSEGATAILEVLSQVKVGVQGNTAEGVIKEFQRVLPILTEAYIKVIKNLSPIIGDEAVCTVIDAMTDLECEYSKYMKTFLKKDANGLKKEVNYEPVRKRAEAYTKAVENIAATNECELATPDRLDASTVLGLVLEHLMICNAGLSGCSEAILLEQKCKEPVVVLRFRIETKIK